MAGSPRLNVTLDEDGVQNGVRRAKSMVSEGATRALRTWSVSAEFSLEGLLVRVGERLRSSHAPMVLAMVSARTSLRSMTALVSRDRPRVLARIVDGD
jgi:hypothetical protein